MKELETIMGNPENSEDTYERLAAALDALPHGFPRTPSGVEIRLIKSGSRPRRSGFPAS
jgi:hypothetical protein